MAAGDLTILANAKSWLGDPTGTGVDALVTRLISACSGLVKQYISRDVLLATYDDLRDGNGKLRMMMRNSPIISVSLVKVGSTVIPVRPTWDQTGYVFDVDSILLSGYAFVKGIQNVQVTYRAGYRTVDDAVAIPGTPFQINGLTALIDLWRSDDGVKFQDNGTSLVKVGSGPVAGQYSVDINGLYTFAAADTGRVVLITYGSVPRALENAVIEWVGELYRYKARIGEVSKTLGGQETASYSAKDMPDHVKLMLGQFGSKAPIV